MKLTRKQLALIHIAKARVGLNDEDYRTILMRCGGVTSSRELDALGFELAMDTFHKLDFEPDFARENLGRRAGMASAPQVALIRALWREYTDGLGDDRSLGKWLERTFKVSSIRFLPQEKTRKAIAALKAMKAKKAAKAHDAVSA